jgi:hypothetical protein
MRFYEEIAKEVGLHEAVVYGYIDGWVKTNQNKKTAKHEGHVWMFQPFNKMAEDMPYMGITTIKKAITQLNRTGWLAIGRFNKKGYDKTNWYTTAHGGKDLEYVKFQPLACYGKAARRPMDKPQDDQPISREATNGEDATRPMLWTPDDQSIGRETTDRYHPYIHPSTNPSTHPFKEPCSTSCQSHISPDQYYVADIGRCVDFSTELKTAIVGIKTPRGIEEAIYRDIFGDDLLNIAYVKGGCDAYILP